MSPTLFRHNIEVHVFTAAPLPFQLQFFFLIPVPHLWFFHLRLHNGHLPHTGQEHPGLTEQISAAGSALKTGCVVKNQPCPKRGLAFAMGFWEAIL